MALSIELVPEKAAEILSRKLAPPSDLQHRLCHALEVNQEEWARIGKEVEFSV